MVKMNGLSEKVGTFRDVNRFVRKKLYGASGIEIELVVRPLGSAIQYGFSRYELIYKNGNEAIKEILEAESEQDIFKSAIEKFEHLGRNYYIEFDKGASTVSVYKSVEDASKFS
ncbi:MAG: hypothetical protein Q8Q04_03030 [archaeon]|nr:hypothetical protein [archaeon]